MEIKSGGFFPPIFFTLIIENTLKSVLKGWEKTDAQFEIEKTCFDLRQWHHLVSFISSNMETAPTLFPAPLVQRILMAPGLTSMNVHHHPESTTSVNLITKNPLPDYEPSVDQIYSEMFVSLLKKFHFSNFKIIIISGHRTKQI